MTQYSLLKMRHRIYNNKGEYSHNYEKLRNLIFNYLTVIKDISSQLYYKSEEDFNEDEDKIVDNIYNYVIENAEADYLQDFNFSKSFIKNKILQLYQLINRDKDSFVNMRLKNNYYFRIYENNMVTSVLNQGMIMTGKQFNHIRLDFYDPYDPLSIHRLQFNMKSKAQRYDIDVYYKKKIQDVQEDKSETTSIFYDDNGIAIVTGKKQYYFDFKEFKSQFESYYLELDDKDSIMRQFYDQRLNALYVFIRKIYHHIILKQNTKTIVIYDNNYSNNEDVDIDDLNSGDHFSQIFNNIIYYLSKAYMIEVKRYRLNEDVIKYVPIFNMNVLREQNVKIQNVDVEENERQVIFNQTKEHIIPVVLNAAFNLKRHYEKDFKIDESRYDYTESTLEQFIDTPDLHLSMQYK